ncbi:hypothetical protein PN498_21485 [Oscillatoria sp. CS-180]|uniref:hypothetical protein n=1 Tax=Oscillatoria sp. CS-180 TaxID=3021720 RepID=UPI00232C5BAA|nr:hypothetical protein [Oscillatoria sp. CS-180]MDB9528580.1 hypothetical protein [Oscillatoria sp. CS-180]
MILLTRQKTPLEQLGVGVEPWGQAPKPPMWDLTSPHPSQDRLQYRQVVGSRDRLDEIEF